MPDRTDWWTSLTPSAAANLAAVWIPVGLPGFAGRDKAVRAARLDERFGPDGWRLAHVVRGRVVAAGCVESVAFNPTIGAAQAAMVELAAARTPGTEVAGAWLAKRVSAAVDPEPGFRALMGAVAPGAGLRVVEWRGLSG